MNYFELALLMSLAQREMVTSVVIETEVEE